MEAYARIILGNVLDGLRLLGDGTVSTIVTSPPYYGLRSYGTDPVVWGGDPECAHAFGVPERSPRANAVPGPNGRGGMNAKGRNETKTAGAFCSACGAWRGELGHEPTPELFVAHLVDVFREARRVLRGDGTLWLNIGDSFAATHGGAAGDTIGTDGATRNSRRERGRAGVPPGLKPKDLIGIPWMLAFALRADGWYLRSDIIWSKPSPMPESVTDRPTRAHEYVFLLSKSRRYHYDAHAIREPLAESSVRRLAQDVEAQAGSTRANGGAREERPMKTVVFGGAKGQGDFGSAARRASGRAWEPTARPQLQRARELFEQAGLTDAHLDAIRAAGLTDAGQNAETQHGAGRNAAEVLRLAEEAKTVLGGYYREFLLGDGANARSVWTIASQPYKEAHFAVMPPALAEKCIRAGCPEGGVVLDPFSGSGTVGEIALRLGRSYVGLEINPAYVLLQQKRVGQARSLFATVDVEEARPARRLETLDAAAEVAG